MSELNLSGAQWRTSKRSGSIGTECVEVAALAADRVVAARDSKDPAGPVLAFGPAEWGAFLADVKSGAFDG